MTEPSAARATFGRRFRLRSSREFQAVYSARSSVRTRNLVLCYLPNEHGHARLGLSVSRKVGNAVCRNRVKRILREVFRTERSRMPSGLDLVLIPHHAEGLKDLDDARAVFRKLVRKLERKLALPS